MLKVVCAIILNEQGNYLAVKRSAGMNHPLKWEFPGGKMEHGEKPGKAVQRELKEELDVEVIPMRILRTTIWEYPDKKVGLIPIICELRLSQIRLREHDNYGWFSLQELMEMDLLEADKAILNQLD
jgi:8-oxo-dGTP diphosphatase